MKLSFLLLGLCPLFFFPHSWGKEKTWGFFNSHGHRFEVRELLRKRGVIWGMESLSPEEILFTEREGKLFRFHLKSQKLTPIKGFSISLANQGQGGLFDVKLHPQFSQNKLVFLSYAKKLRGKTATTVLARGKLLGNRWHQHKELFAATPPSKKLIHFGGRIAIKRDKLFLTVGDRGTRKNAQSLSNHSGKIHRFDLDGNIPPDNPFSSVQGAQKSIYSYGHRNPQGLDFHPKTGALWEHEHGPRGGDEINLIQPGSNYGWATISHGKEYWGPFQVGEGTAQEGMKQPLKVYTPSIAPSGMAFYQGSLFSRWQGSLFLGSLAFKHLNHLSPQALKLEKGKGKKDLLSKKGEHRLLKSLGMRVRNVLILLDGSVLISTDEGSLLRLLPFPN